MFSCCCDELLVHTARRHISFIFWEFSKRHVFTARMDRFKTISGKSLHKQIRICSESVEKAQVTYSGCSCVVKVQVLATHSRSRNCPFHDSRQIQLKSIACLGTGPISSTKCCRCSSASYRSGKLANGHSDERLPAQIFIHETSYS